MCIEWCLLPVLEHSLLPIVGADASASHCSQSVSFISRAHLLAPCRVSVTPTSTLCLPPLGMFRDSCNSSPHAKVSPHTCFAKYVGRTVKLGVCNFLYLLCFSSAGEWNINRVCLPQSLSIQSKSFFYTKGYRSTLFACVPQQFERWNMAWVPLLKVWWLVRGRCVCSTKIEGRQLWEVFTAFHCILHCRQKRVQFQCRISK